MNVPRDPTNCTSILKTPTKLFDQGRNCGLRIKNTEWQNPVTFPVKLIETDEYKLVPPNPDGTFRIGLKTLQDNNLPAWSEIELQDVYVHVSD